MGRTASSGKIAAPALVFGSVSPYNKEEKAVVFLLWVLLILLVLLLACLAAAVFMFDFAIRRVPRFTKLPPEPEQGARGALRREGEAYLAARPHEEWTIAADDGTRLCAGFWPADAPTGKTVLAIHGYRCSGTKEYGLFAKFYHSLGYNLLLPDNRAHGASGGGYVGFGWLDAADCIAWAREAARRIPDCSILLHGISMGSATVLMAAGQDGLPPWIKGVVADCGYSSAWDQFIWQMKQMFHLPPFPILHLASLICRLRAGYWFGQANTLAWVKHIRVPVQFIHGGADTYVPTAMVQPLYEACPAQKFLCLVPGAPHAASYSTDPKLYENTVKNFVQTIGF